jgi:hypothetical protein
MGFLSINHNNNNFFGKKLDITDKAFADANCDNAGDTNSRENFRGNVKQCRYTTT